MKIGIIGAGKVGVSLGRHFKKHDLNVVGIYSRKEASAQKGADLMAVTCFEGLKEIVLESEMLFLTVPDSAIEPVWDEISQFDLKGKIICHCSGALSSHVFQGIEQLGSWGYAAHPAMTISHKEAEDAFQKAPIVLEGAIEKWTVVRAFFEALGHPVIRLAAVHKSLYHCAAVFSSNFVVALAKISMDLLAKCGFSEHERPLFLPLMLRSVENIHHHGTTNALTGPVERGDVATIVKHLTMLETEHEQMYQLLSQTLIEIAEIKNPNQDYKELQEMLKKSSQ